MEIYYLATELYAFLLFEIQMSNSIYLLSLHYLSYYSLTLSLSVFSFGSVWITASLTIAYQNLQYSETASSISFLKHFQLFISQAYQDPPIILVLKAGN